jgi:L-asparaginase
MDTNIAYEHHVQPTSEHPNPQRAILLIYTGGTIGAVPSDRNDPRSPLTIATWGVFEAGVPEITLLRKCGLLIDTVTLRKPIDSSNIEPRNWTTFVEIIEKFYDDYMGFVILHGTDTMVYTASALSFMLEGLDKPVVITGSQVPILDQPGTDGTRNLVNAIKVAAYRVFGLPKVQEVCIAFDKVLLRGNRARKLNADALGGFDSPNFPPLGRLEAEISINTSLLWNPKSAFTPRRKLDPNVISILIFPGIQSSQVLAQCLSLRDLRAAVLQSYGTGNAPTSNGFLDPIYKAIQKDKKIILDVTQCISGSVRLGQYETGIELIKLGVLTGFDITPEAALCKLMVLLGRSEMTHQLSRFLQQSLSGEQSENLFSTDLIPAGGSGELDGIGTRVNLVPQTTYDTHWLRASPYKALLHLRDAAVTVSADADSVLFEVYFNVDADTDLHLDPDTDPASRFRGFAGKHKRCAQDHSSFVAFDVTGGMSALKPGRPPSVTIILKSAGRLTFNGATLLVFTQN